MTTLHGDHVSLRGDHVSLHGDRVSLRGGHMQLRVLLQTAYCMSAWNVLLIRGAKGQSFSFFFGANSSSRFLFPSRFPFPGFPVACAILTV